MIQRTLRKGWVFYGVKLLTLLQWSRDRKKIKTAPDYVVDLFQRA
jgi:hypothetical protein